MVKTFTPTMRLADLIAANHYLVLALPRVGIPLGFGDKSVAEVCRLYGVPVDFFLMICNAYTFDSYLPDAEELAETDMSPLVPYLIASHHYYLDNRIEHIDNHLQHVADKIGGRSGDMLKKFFDDYRDEVVEHFRFEEQDAFPPLENLQQGKHIDGSVSAKMGRHFKQAHGNIEDKLSDLTQIAYKYLPQNALTDEAIEMIFDVLQLSVDLKKHELIEEKILLPYVKWLEKK